MKDAAAMMTDRRASERYRSGWGWACGWPGGVVWRGVLCGIVGAGVFSCFPLPSLGAAPPTVHAVHAVHANPQPPAAPAAPASESFEDWLQRGEAALRSGDSDAARRAFETACSRAVSVEEKVRSRLRVASTHASVPEVPQARVHLERALAIPGLGKEQRGLILLKLAEGHVAEYNSEAALALVEEVLSGKTVSAGVRAGARLVRARVNARYGVAWAWEKVRTECTEVLADPEAPSEARVGAHVLLAEALLTQRQFEPARQSMRWVAENERAPAVERTRQQLALVRTLLLEGKPAEARRDLPAARDQVERLGRVPVSTREEELERNSLAARCELLEGLVWRGLGDATRAREFLGRVKTMPGQNSASPETREAAVELRLRGLAPEGGECLKVLTVGSSLTIRGNIPWMLEQLSESAPAGRPRICVGEHVRMGTGMRTFWMEGEAPDTVRYKMKSAPWDVVVVESFYRMPEADLEQYTRLYADLARERGARLVLYETPASRLLPYPDGCAPYHRAVMRVGALLRVPVAPSLVAWMQVLGQAPREADYGRLYSDGLHATLKGAYLNACSVYAAVTGESPVGLFYPEGLAAEEAREFQQAAWDTFRRTREEIAGGNATGNTSPR